MITVWDIATQPWEIPVAVEFPISATELAASDQRRLQRVSTV